MLGWLRNWGALTAIILLAAFFRFDGLRWDDGIYAHPDERYMTMLSASLHGDKLVLTDTEESTRVAHQALCERRYPGSAGVGPWLDTECSTFNPENVGYAHYPYGQLPLTVVRLAAELSQRISGWAGFVQYGGIHLVGRAFSATVDLLTLLALFLLGRLAWNRKIGVLAAGLYAVAVLPIQLSHFWTVDTCANLCATVALIFLVRLARFGERGDAFALGAAYGLALASKVSLLPMMACLPLALYFAPRQAGSPLAQWLSRYLLPGLLAGLGAWLTFRIASPYAFSSALWSDFLPRPEFITQLFESRRLASGAVDIPPNWQWLGRQAWVWPGMQLLVWGLGVPLGLAALVALARLGWRLRRPVPVQRGRAVIWLWCVAYFLWMGQQWVATMRYFLPIYPLLCLLVAAWLYPWWRARPSAAQGLAGRRIASALPLAVGGVVVLASVAWALAFHSVHRTIHPYLASTHWVLRNVAGAVSATLAAPAGNATQINWPARGEYGDGIPPRVAAATLAPVSGVITALRMPHLRIQPDAGVPVVLARILDAQGQVLATTRPHTLAGTVQDADLALVEPLDLQGGERYQLQIEVRGGRLTLEGTRIAHEGAWNDVVPTRVPWLPMTEDFSFSAKSGTVPRETAQVDPYGDGYYTPIDLGMTSEDDEAKRARLIEGLDQAEWVVIPNNRFYGAMTRNPLRYPLSSQFYDALFAGTLGFAREQVVSSPPRLAGVTIHDQVSPEESSGAMPPRAAFSWAAEEAFSVYDHPTVYVFRKTSAYSRERVMQMFSGLPLSDVRAALQAPKPALAGRLAWSTQEADYAPAGLLRNVGQGGGPDAVPATDLGAGATAVGVLSWYLIAMLLGLCARPMLRAVWPVLADGGYGVARIAGLLMLVLPAWWLLWLGVPIWSGPALWMLCLSGVIAAAWRYHKHWRVYGEWEFWRRDFLRVELLFLALFSLGLLARAINPDLWAPAFGGEKPMDFAYFNSVLGTEALPPADPWFSGGRMNYYYFGWMLVAGLAKLSGVRAALAYNLALATWFAMIGVGAFSLAWNLWLGGVAKGGGARGAWIAGVAALSATVLIGNLDLPRAWAPNLRAAQAVLQSGEVAPQAVWDALTAHSERWMWAPSRTVGERPGSSSEINEFPAFSFLYGDLHPHFMALPLQLLILCALCAMVLTPAALPAAQAPPRRGALVAQLVIVAGSLAALRSSNSWDWPTYLGLSILSCVLVARKWHSVSQRLLLPGWAWTGAIVTGLIALQAVLALPFSHYFVTGPLALHGFAGKPTALSAWLAMQGWFILVILAWAGRLASTPAAVSPIPHGVARVLSTVLRIVVLSGVLHAAFSALRVWTSASAEVPAAGLQLALLAWLAECLLRHAGERRRSVALSLALAGFGLAFVVEFIVIGADIGRMNTFFKFYLQSWLLLSVAAGFALADLGDLGLPARVRRILVPVFVAASAICLAYLPCAQYGRAQTRFTPHAPITLDGEGFFATAVYALDGTELRLADDYRMIQWLRANTGRDDILLEAQLPEYRWGGRMSVFTGRQTVLGYRHHQSQQRPIAALGEAIELRKQNVQAIYAGEDASATLAALQHYGVDYLVIGGLERAVYPAAGLAKFAAMCARGELMRVYQVGDDLIYRVVHPAGHSPVYGAHW